MRVFVQGYLNLSQIGTPRKTGLPGFDRVSTLAFAKWNLRQIRDISKDKHNALGAIDDVLPSSIADGATIINMKNLLPLIFLVFVVSGYAQSAEQAVVTYSVNYKLIGLSNLMGLSECSVKTMVGKVRKIDKSGTSAEIGIKIDKKLSTVTVPLERVPEEHRDDVFDHLITKNNTLRVSGYACTADAPFSAFSVDRVY